MKQALGHPAFRNEGQELSLGTRTRPMNTHAMTPMPLAAGADVETRQLTTRLHACSMDFRPHPGAPGDAKEKPFTPTRRAARAQSYNRMETRGTPSARFRRLESENVHAKGATLRTGNPRHLREDWTPSVTDPLSPAQHLDLCPPAPVGRTHR